MAHHFAKSCVRSGAEASAYWRDVGTIDAYWEANIDLTDVVPQLDLFDRNWPIWTYAEITPPSKFVHDEEGRRGEAVSSLVSGGCIVSGAALRRSLLFTGVRVHSYATVENAVILPYVDIGELARLKNVVIDRGVQIPEGLVVGEDPGTRCQTLPSDRARHQPYHPTHDRKARRMTALRLLSVASEIYPLIKTGGLADVTGALPAALAARGRCGPHPDPRLSVRCRQAWHGGAGRTFPDLFGGTARILAGTAAGLDLFVLDAPHLYDRPGDPYRGPDGRDWPDNALRFAALAQAALEWVRGWCRVSCRTSSMLTIGRRGWRRRCCSMPARGPRPS